MNDVDYAVVKNKNSLVEHLVVDVGVPTETVCGLGLKPVRDPGLYSYISMTMRKFWRSNLACKNCKRAAKH